MDETCRNELRELKEDKENGLLTTPELQHLRQAAVERATTRLAQKGASRPGNARPDRVGLSLRRAEALTVLRAPPHSACYLICNWCFHGAASWRCYPAGCGKRHRRGPAAGTAGCSDAASKE